MEMAIGRMKFDSTLSWPMVGGLVLAIMSGSVAYSQLTNRVDDLGKAVTAMAAANNANAALYRPRLEAVERAQGIAENRLENVVDSLREDRRVSSAVFDKVSKISEDVASIKAQLGERKSR